VKLIGEMLKLLKVASILAWLSQSTGHTWLTLLHRGHSHRVKHRTPAQGKTSHTNELHKLVGAKFKELAQNLKGAAGLLKANVPAGTQPPHMEAGAMPPEAAPRGEQAKKEALAKLQKEGQGTDDDIDKVIRTLLPDDDPFLT
jgi:hypothetical protein